jgi:hypothetical protein
MLYADMQRARMRAVKENRKISIRFVRESHEEYYYFVNSNNQWNLGDFRRDISEHAGIFYGCKGTARDWKKDKIPPSGLPERQFVTFSRMGTANPVSIFLYSMNKQNICYAVTTTNYGYIKIRRFNGTSWEN